MAGDIAETPALVGNITEGGIAMSTGISKDEMEAAGQILETKNTVDVNLKTIEKWFEKMNNHSKKIINFEGEESKEGIMESGRIQGRLDMLKLFHDVFKDNQ